MGLSTTSRGSKPCALHCDALDSLMCHNSLCRRDGEIHAIPGRPNGRVFCKGSCDLGCSLVTRLRFSPQLAISRNFVPRNCYPRPEASGHGRLPMKVGLVTSYMPPHLGGIEQIAENL